MYSTGYFHGGDYANYETEEKPLQLNFRGRIAELKRRHPGGGSLWEVGAACGYFLQAASAHFTVAGCDISEWASQQARDRFGLDVRCQDYLSINCPHPLDVVCMWDTIEHLRAPEAYVQKAASDLRPGGTLALSTGDIGSIVARLRRRNWRLLTPPFHLHFFAARSMRALLHRTGFEAVDIRYLPFWRSADTIAHRLVAYPEDKPGAALYRALSRRGLLNFTVPFNSFDIMTVHARKR